MLKKLRAHLSSWPPEDRERVRNILKSDDRSDDFHTVWDAMSRVALDHLAASSAAAVYKARKLIVTHHSMVHETQCSSQNLFLGLLKLVELDAPHVFTEFRDISAGSFRRLRKKSKVRFESFTWTWVLVGSGWKRHHIVRRLALIGAAINPEPLFPVSR